MLVAIKGDTLYQNMVYIITWLATSSAVKVHKWCQRSRRLDTVCV